MLATLSVRPRDCDQIRSGRWIAGSTTSSTYSSRAATRRARCAGTSKPRRSSAPAWTSSASRRRTLTRRWSTSGHSFRDRAAPATVFDAPERPASDVASGPPSADRASILDPGVAGHSIPVAAPCAAEQWLQRFDDRSDDGPDAVRSPQEAWMVPYVPVYNEGINEGIMVGPTAESLFS